MEFRKRKDSGQAFPLGGRNPDRDTFNNLRAQDTARAAGRVTQEMENRMTTVRELLLWSTNDQDTYRMVYEPWFKWALERIEKGKPIDKEKMAEAVMKYKVKLVHDGYQKQFGNFPIDSQERKILAREIADYSLNLAVEDYANNNNLKISTVEERALKGWSPDKKYYVTMTDKFMSGWGQAAGKVNKLVIEASSYDEAAVVAANAKSRGEMKNVKS
jgi:hypothetical protein